MHQALAFLIGLVLLCDLTVLGVHVLDDKTSLVTGRTSEGNDPRILPGPGQAFLAGEVDRLVADKAQVPALRTPFTITAVEQGVGRLSIEKALVSGRRVTISWDGGTPLPLSGEGALELGATRVEVDGEGMTWSLDGAARTFVAGTYALEAPVAVGTGGLATPQEGIEFTADGETVLASRGNVVVHQDPSRVVLLGPGTVEATGALQVQYPDRRTSASAVRFGEGPFQLTVEPSGGKPRVNGVLQGDVKLG